MIHPGDRVLLAVSGGKDSMTMARVFPLLRRGLGIDFEFAALHVRSDFAQSVDLSAMKGFLDDWGVPWEIIEVGVQKRLKPGQKMNCYWCSTQRRTELLKYARAKGYNKIALGHHMDDILETFLMNMMLKGELSTMMPVLPYEQYPQTVIRPMSLLSEEEIIAFADWSGIRKYACTCGYDTQSRRRDVRRVLDTMEEEFGRDVKRKMFQAMGNPVLSYLPVPQKNPAV